MIVDTYKRTVLCVYRHRPTRISALASANVGVSRCRYTCGMELAPGGKQVQVMQVMQHLFPTHVRTYLKEEEEEGLCFLIIPSFFSLSDDSLFLPTLQATACGVFGYLQLLGFFQEGLIGETRI